MLKKKKKRLKSLSKLKAEAQKAVNQYIRARDCIKTTGSADYCKCITCGKTKSAKEIQAGHYIPLSSSSLLRFEEKNINGQCAYCNCWGHGMLAEYTIFIDHKWGKGTAEALIAQRGQVKLWKRWELEEIRDNYRFKNSLL